MTKNAHLLPLVVMVLFCGMGASADDDEPADVVEAFHRALEEGDRATVLRLLAADAVILESGGYEASRDEYASHHLGADMEFSAATERTVDKRWVGRRGEVAWVLTSTRIRGRFRDRDIDVRGVETMLLEHTDGQWRIAHIHWSSPS